MEIISRQILNIPFLKRNDVMFISATGNAELDTIVRKSSSSIQKSLPRSYRFTYIPSKLSSMLNKETRQYLYPGLDDATVAQVIYSLIQVSLPEDMRGQDGFLYNDGSRTILYPIGNASDGQGYHDLINQFKDHWICEDSMYSLPSKPQSGLIKWFKKKAERIENSMASLYDETDDTPVHSESPEENHAVLEEKMEEITVASPSDTVIFEACAPSIPAGEIDLLQSEDESCEQMPEDSSTRFSITVKDREDNTIVACQKRIKKSDQSAKVQTGKETTDEDEKRLERIQLEIKDLLDRYNLSFDDLLKFVPKTIKTSKVLIDRNYKIILEDFGMEVKMDPLTKSVWLLFLRHPEGIRQKAMSDHYKELFDLYNHICNRGDVQTMKTSVERLTNPNDNSLNEKISKANKAFKSSLRDDVSSLYCITGPVAMEKSIQLDRSLVKWAI